MSNDRLMKTAKKDVIAAIGNTPIVKLNKVAQHVKAHLYVKCEFMNPGGSVKDRIGIYMIEQAEKEGKLKPGGTIIEATSGNTGLGLAMAAAMKGYKCIFVMADKQSEEKRTALRSTGAQVVICPTNVEARRSAQLLLGRQSFGRGDAELILQPSILESRQP